MFAKIRDGTVLVAIVLVILSVGLFSFTKMSPEGSAEGIVLWLLLLVAFCGLFSVFPAVAIIYGWYTGNRAGAILTGVLPLPLFFVAGFLHLRSDNMVFISPDTFLFIPVLSAICGFAGFFAAQRAEKYLAVSIILTGLWLIIWMWSFN
jgi:hypothetical protein